LRWLAVLLLLLLLRWLAVLLLLLLLLLRWPLLGASPLLMWLVVRVLRERDRRTAQPQDRHHRAHGLKRFHRGRS
jgi:hypothetical protein